MARKDKSLRIAELEDCIEGLVYQFGVIRGGMLSSGCLSAMERAFEVLGWPDPCPAPADMLCDEPGCLEQSTCGFPTPEGYRHTCGKHSKLG